MEIKMFQSGLCWDDDYTIAQWLEHQTGYKSSESLVRVTGGDSQFFLQALFHVCLLSTATTSQYYIILNLRTACCFVLFELISAAQRK